MTLEDGRYGGEYSISDDHVPTLPCSGQQGFKRGKDVTYSLSCPWGSSIGIEPCLSPYRLPLDFEGLVWNTFEEKGRRYRSVEMGNYRRRRAVEIARILSSGDACKMEDSMFNILSHLNSFGLVAPALFSRSGIGPERILAKFSG